MPRIGWMKLPLGLLVTLRDFFFSATVLLVLYDIISSHQVAIF